MKLLLERWGIKIQKDAEKDRETIVVGAAPDEVKDQIINWLEKQKASAGIAMKFVYTIIIRAVPMIADQLWDKLFQNGHVSRPLADFTATVFAADGSEDSLLVDLL